MRGRSSARRLLSRLVPRNAASHIRLYVDRELVADARFALDKGQAHYVANVMRLDVGDSLALFNGHDGEWQATVISRTKGSAQIEITTQARTQENVPDLWLALAPTKSTRSKYVVEKATELGVAALLPVITQHTVAKASVDRYRAQAIEAAEQCGRLSVPSVHEAQSLTQFLDSWPQARLLIFCDETRSASPLIEAVADHAKDAAGGWGLLIGPEGGFASDEVERLRGLPFVIPAKLGPRILRTDTAAIAALSLWQAVAGDWR